MALLLLPALSLLLVTSEALQQGHPSQIPRHSHVRSARRGRVTSLETPLPRDVLPPVNLQSLASTTSVRSSPHFQSRGSRWSARSRGLAGYMPVGVQQRSFSACPEFTPCQGCGEGVRLCRSTPSQPREAPGGAPLESPDVALLENVFVDWHGHVFNSSHRFLFGGWTEEPWQDSEKVVFGAGTRVLEVDALVNVAISPRSGASRHHLFETVHRLPLFLRLAPLMPQIRKQGVPFFMGRHKVVRQSLGPVLGIAPWQNHLVPERANCTLLFVKRLLQPIHNSPKAPQDPLLWDSLRRTFLLRTNGLPIFSPDWTLRRPKASSRSPEEDANLAASLPGDWKAVLAVAPASLPVRFRTVKYSVFPWETLQGMAGAQFWSDRLATFSGSLRREDAVALFRRAAVGITSPGASLSYLPFMRRGSALVFLNPDSDKDTQSQNVWASTVRDLAQAFGIQLFEVQCQRAAQDALQPERLRNGRQVRELDSKGEVGPTSPLPRAVEHMVCEHNFVAEALSAAASFLYSSPLLPGHSRRNALNASLPGTTLSEAKGVEDFSKWRECVIKRGHWARDPLPRRQAWGRPEFYNPGTCDNGFLHGKEANAVADSVAPLVAKINGVSRADQGKSVLTQKEKERLEQAVAHWGVRETLKFRWEVNEAECPMPGEQVKQQTARTWEAFSPVKFCQNLPGSKRILFIGDSLAEQSSQALVANLLRDAGYPVPPADVVTESVPAECLPLLDGEPGVTPKTRCFRYRFTLGGGGLPSEQGSCSMEVLFLRNERLRMGTEGLPKGRVLHALPFHTTLRGLLDQSDVLLLNRGAHFTPTDQFEREVLDTSRFLRERYPEKLIIWRNTPPGHVNCTKYDSPLTEPQDPSSLPKTFAWDHFQSQNEVVERISQDLGFVYFDAYALGVLRADGHRGLSISKKGKEVTDCLHYCLPGPFDPWMELLQNLLKQVTQKRHG